jgi:hypothetical protein
MRWQKSQSQRKKLGFALLDSQDQRRASGSFEEAKEMTQTKPAPKDLITESDVEQKFLYPFLTSGFEFGMGIEPGSIITKSSIRRFEIDKGKKSKLYYPDYVIVLSGIPLVVVEAKEPKVDLTDAYREARLYANELNAIFSTHFNPVSFVCTSNGLETWIGRPDTREPELKILLENAEIYSAEIATAQSFIGVEELKRRANELGRLRKPPAYFKPRRLLGGLAVQQEEVGQNAFGATLTAELANIFNPLTRSDRLKVAKDAYVTSPRKDRYVGPIDRVIRAATPVWEARATLIKDPSQPSELLKPFEAQRELEHNVMLLIGERGSGKTSFLYHLQAEALPPDVRDKTLWVHLDVNSAPLVRHELYDWIRKAIIENIKILHSDIDFDGIEITQRIFSVEINKFNKGVGSLLQDGSSEKNFEIYKLVLSCQSNLNKMAECYTRFFGSEKGKLVVIVFDNADKQPSHDQLLMFEAAQWLQKEFRVLVVLPIREETFEKYRDKAPLDTALKDLVFRIEPPVFQQALVKRVQMALNQLGSGKRRDYELPNGFRINYPENERAYYLSSLVASIFVHDSYVRRLIMGLAGNDVRKMFEIFVGLCGSGHISEAEMLRMRQSKGDYILPLDVVMTVLLRNNMRYYDGDISILKNILDLDDKDSSPTHFSRILILSFLRSKFNETGPSGAKGYFSGAKIYEALSVYGLSLNVVMRELNYLVMSDCVITESLSKNYLNDTDLVRIHSVGFVHLELLGVAEYWAAIAEDTNFSDKNTASRISERIALRDSHFTAPVSIQNGRAAFDYIQQIRANAAKTVASMLSHDEFLALTDISVGDEALVKKGKAVPGGPWFDAVERFPTGSEVEGIVVNVVVDIGLFVELSPGVVGLLHKSRLAGGAVTDQAPKVGDVQLVRVVQIDTERRRVSLSLAQKSKAGA